MLSLSTRVAAPADLPAEACLIAPCLPATACFPVTAALRGFERESVAIYYIQAGISRPSSTSLILTRRLIRDSASHPPRSPFSEPPCRYRLWRVLSTIG